MFAVYHHPPTRLWCVKGYIFLTSYGDTIRLCNDNRVNSKLVSNLLDIEDIYYTHNTSLVTFITAQHISVLYVSLSFE